MNLPFFAMSLRSVPCLLLGLLLRGVLVSAAAQPAPTATPGNFDPVPSAGAAAANIPARPRVTAHSPRDDDAAWTPTTFATANPRLPTLVIAGDSTASTGDPAHRGWGAVLVDYFDITKINLVNAAIGGRSFRTFYGEGAWEKVVAGLKPGDYAVIEFGHNDGGSPSSVGTRGDLPGIGDETLEVPGKDGRTEVVHTFGWYARRFIKDARAKGATPILSTTSVRNIWKNPHASFRDATITTREPLYTSADDHVERGMGGMLGWAREVADAEHVPFLDHSNITADRYEKLGREQVAKFFPADHTHTSTDGALLNAETFIAGLKTLPCAPVIAALNPKGRAIAPWTPAADNSTATTAK